MRIDTWLAEMIVTFTILPRWISRHPRLLNLCEIFQGLLMACSRIGSESPKDQKAFRALLLSILIRQLICYYRLKEKPVILDRPMTSLVHLYLMEHVGKN